MSIRIISKLYGGRYIDVPLTVLNLHPKYLPEYWPWSEMMGATTLSKLLLKYRGWFKCTERNIETGQKLCYTNVDNELSRCIQQQPSSTYLSTKG